MMAVVPMAAMTVAPVPVMATLRPRGGRIREGRQRR